MFSELTRQRLLLMLHLFCLSIIAYSCELQYIQDMDKWNRITAGKLFYEGSNFLFGMLFRACFPSFGKETSIATTDVPLQEASGPQKPASPLSFVLHSVGAAAAAAAAAAPESDAATAVNVDAEVKCLRQLLLPPPPQRNYDGNIFTTTHCIIYLLLPDHPRTAVVALTDWIASNCNCTVVITASETSSFNAVGRASFLQDLALGSQARTGITGDPNLSFFQLLEELIAYDSIMEVPRQRRLTSVIPSVLATSLLPHVHRCELRRREHDDE